MVNKLNMRIELDGILKIDGRRKKFNNITARDRKILGFIIKLSKEYNVILSTAQDEVMAAKWLMDNDAGCLLPCLLSKEETFVVYINTECLNTCQDFDKFYDVLIGLAHYRQ